MKEETPQLRFRNRPDRLLRDTEAATLLGVGRSTFHRWVAAGELPKPVKMGGLARWWQSEIEAYLEQLTDARDACCAV